MTVRLLCTNDFAGTWDPAPASFGWLPGARGMRRTVELLRGGTPSLWIDVGDLVSGSALSLRGGPDVAFRAAESLGVDVAVPGNHEFDWGVEEFRHRAAGSSLNYLCANAEIGLPATRVISTDAETVGLIGLTYPLIGTLSGGPTGLGQRSPDELVPELAAELRRSGADLVVVLVHDGVPGPIADVGPIRPGQLPFLGSWYPHVDAVVGGHTLWRFCGVLDGLAICQPEAFGVEVGVLELGRGKAPRVGGVRPTPDGDWDGPGADVLASSRDRLLATPAAPLVSVLAEDNPLLGALASRLRELAGTDAAMVTLWDSGVTQPVGDGVAAYVPAGPFTEADLLRFAPYAPEEVAVVEMTAHEYAASVDLAWIPFLPTMGTAGDVGNRRGPLRVAFSHRQGLAAAARLGRVAESAPAGPGGRLTMTDVWVDVLRA